MREIVGPCRRTTAALLACVLAAALLALATPAHAADCRFADAQPGQASAADMSAATLCLLNERRAAAGLDALRPSRPLATTALGYSEYMVARSHFGHQDESGHNVAWRVLSAFPSLAERWSLLGENLGWGTYAAATPRAMVDGWMGSPSHRENVLSPRYEEVGVGIADGAPVSGRTGALTYTAVFGDVVSGARATSSGAVTQRKRPRACRRARTAKRSAVRKRARRVCKMRLARRAARTRALSAARG